MTPFFNTPERIAALVAAADALEGTPFAPGGCIAGPRGGMCCHRSVIWVLEHAGFPVHQWQIADGPMTRGTHHVGSAMAAWLDTQSDRFMPLQMESWESLQAGDVLIIRNGVGSHHAALLLAQGRVLQSFQQIGVHIVTGVYEQRRRLITHVYRPISP